MTDKAVIPPTGMTQRGSTWYVRVVVPPALREYFGFAARNHATGHSDSCHDHRQGLSQRPVPTAAPWLESSTYCFVLDSRKVPYRRNAYNLNRRLAAKQSHIQYPLESKSVAMLRASAQLVAASRACSSTGACTSYHQPARSCT